MNRLSSMNESINTPMETPILRIDNNSTLPIMRKPRVVKPRLRSVTVQIRAKRSRSRMVQFPTPPSEEPIVISPPHPHNNTIYAEPTLPPKSRYQRFIDFILCRNRSFCCGNNGVDDRNGRGISSIEEIRTEEGLTEEERRNVYERWMETMSMIMDSLREKEMIWTKRMIVLASSFSFLSILFICILPPILISKILRIRSELTPHIHHCLIHSALFHHPHHHEHHLDKPYDDVIHDMMSLGRSRRAILVDVDELIEHLKKNTEILENERRTFNSMNNNKEREFTILSQTLPYSVAVMASGYEPDGGPAYTFIESPKDVIATSPVPEIIPAAPVFISESQVLDMTTSPSVIELCCQYTQGPHGPPGPPGMDLVQDVYTTIQSTIQPCPICPTVYPGPPGPPGPKGPPGFTQIITYPGHPGKPGEIGVRGPDGPQGYPGPIDRSNIIEISLTGKEGPSGPRGSIGREGVMGRSGRRGKEGRKGPEGNHGRDGVPGNPGRPGVPGRQGIDGRVGECNCENTKMIPSYESSTQSYTHTYNDNGYGKQISSMISSYGSYHQRNHPTLIETNNK